MKRLALRRPAYTAAELLLAICVIVLVLFLLPACVHRGDRIEGRANECRNKLRNLALAVAQYEVHRGHYPGYREDIDRTAAVSPNDDRSWIFVILPYIDHRSAYDQYRIPGTLNEDINLPLEILCCPSMSPDQLGIAANCYVANTGLPDGPPASGRSADFAANGVFHDHVPVLRDTPIVRIHAGYISAGDGLSTTLMLSENADAARWTGGPSVNGSGIVPSERWLGFTWHDADGIPGDSTSRLPLQQLGINVRTSESHHTKPQSAALGFARPSSYHPGGVNMAFCDGRVRFVSEDISYGVYQALMTPRGSEAMYVSHDELPQQPLPVEHAARQKVREEDIQ